MILHPYAKHARRALEKVRAADVGDPEAQPHDLVRTRTQLELERLAGWYAAGELTPEQEREWLELSGEIAAAMPAIERLGLDRFRFPKDHPPLLRADGYLRGYDIARWGATTSAKLR